MEAFTADEPLIAARKQFQAELVRRQLCCPSPTNPRKTFPEAEMLELRSSVKKHGILQPLVVRLWPANTPWQGDMMPLYEIVCGERRWRSADAEGLEFVPVVVKSLTDEEVQAIQIIENLQRADLHEMEEAEGYQRMMAEFGRTADELAKEVDKSKAYIYARLKLTALCPEGREAFRDGRLNASTALLVARIPVASLQAKAVEEITEPDWEGDLPSVREVKRILRDRYMLDLNKAPFSLEDATLKPDAGTCADCPHRTGNQPELYGDVDADVCTIPDCLQEKQAAWAARKIEAASQIGQVVHQGAEAKRIAPHGIYQASLHQGYIALSYECYEAPRAGGSEVPTYQQLLQNALPEDQIELLKDEKGNLHQIAKQETVAKALAEQGIKIHIYASSGDKDKQRQAEAKRENLYRAELFSQISAKLAAELAPPLRTYIILEQTSTLLARTLLDRTEFESRKRLARQWGYDVSGTNAHNAINQLRDSIPTLPSDQRARLLIELCLIGEIHVAEYQTIQDPPLMTDLATSFGLDPAAIRRDQKAAAKQKASPPSKAAPAGEGNAQKAPAKPAPTPKKAAPAKGKVTPMKKSSGRACPAGKNEKSKKVMNAKPRGTDTSATPEPTRCDRTRDMFADKEAA